ncbi:xanthine dehydrogenase molybdopterin binding subunit [Dongia sp.]|uniref:xanthine dehydrogenase molybdopterin binding subunit n=1 Tax=Dongia sp. TaxID=1977262 RepID=UPI0035B40371
MADILPTRVVGSVGEARAHDSARKHATGTALYVDDLPEPARCLHLCARGAERAHARLVRLDLARVRNAPGVVCVLTAADIPGTNDVSPIHAHDDPLLCAGEVMFWGQPLFCVAAETRAAARAAVKLAEIAYEDLPAILTVEEALAAKSFVLDDQRLGKGDAAAAIAAAPHRLSGRFRHGGQDHFYLEGQVSLAIPTEDGDVHIHCSTQHPTEVQMNVAQVLGRPANAVTVEVRRMGGGFGGKESQATQWAALAALAAVKTGRPAKFRLDRDDDMVMTGKRHDFIIDWQVGFDDTGRISGVDFVQSARAGFSADLSGAIADRAMFHADNAYYLEHAGILSHRCRTHTVSNTAFRGFGGPQGMLGIEEAIDAIARHLRRDPLDIRKANFYGKGERDVTPYHMKVEDCIVSELVGELERSSDYRARRQAIVAANAGNDIVKRGIALTPVKFGISFTTSHLNQAGALVHIYNDGSVHLNHGGTEMGQGLFQKVAQVVAEELQIDIDRIKISATHTGKVPNTSATAASSGSDMNGKAAQAAAIVLKERLIEFAARHFQVARSDVAFMPNRIRAGCQEISFDALVKLAYLDRVQLSATGFYKTPKIHYDRTMSSGRPFYYFAYGAAASEVAVDTLTGEYRVTRVDILHDAGRSLNPAIDLGQVEGGFIQGMGWLTSEELWWDGSGRLRTHAPSTYKIPTVADRPPDFRVKLQDFAENVEESIHRSKAVGEPPLMLAISVFRAISDAIAGLGDYRHLPRLDAPATPERVLAAIDEMRARTA